ncbi:MAG: sodium-dependent transporter [Bacteroidaceae bacterium]|nr:sodium-dependent transporter [Bacteroidaceae bacterium]
MEKRATFGSKLGIILVSAGSAVGLGNVWRFPTEVGANGGAAFILVYILCVILLGVPLMTAEFIVGRNTHQNPFDAYRTLAPGTAWVFQGGMGVFAAWFILSYYSVVAGWTLQYLISAVMGRVTTMSDSAAYFTEFTQSAWMPVVMTAVVLLMSHWVIVRGVQAGIEKYSKLMMPLLLLIIAVLVVGSFAMPGSSDGLRFLLKPDFSKLDGGVLLSAMGQAFFSLSVGMGCLCTYASYFTDDARLLKTAGSVALIDTMVAVMSGFIIFPAVFSVQTVAPDAGPGLVFITLPSVFQMAFENVPLVGWFFAVMFYLLLLLAALTSMMSLHEPVTALFIERFRLSRRTATSVVTLSCIALGTVCALSFGPLKDVRFLFGLTFFDFFDFLSAKIIMPLGGFLLSIFVGWYLPRNLVIKELTNNHKLRFPRWLFVSFFFLIRWVAPLAIMAIFINELLP